MPIGSAPIQEANSVTNTVVLPGTPTAGNTVFVEYQASGGAEPTVVSMSTSGFSSWVKETSHSPLNAHLELWKGVVNGTPNPSITATLSGSPAGATRLYAAEWPGTYTRDGVSAAANGNSPTPVSATLTPTSGVPMLFFAMVRRGGTFSGGAGNPTNGFIAGTTGDTTKRVDFLVVASTTGTYNTTWTFTATASYDTEIIGFTQDAGVGPTHTLPVSVGSFVLTGSATGLKAGRVLQPASASFVITGNDVQLVGPARATTYTLPVSTAVFVIGPPAPSVASYIITGQNINLRYSGFRNRSNNAALRHRRRY